MTTRLFVPLLLLLVLTGCRPAAAPTLRSAPAMADNRPTFLLDALSFLPAATSRVDLTHWNQLRRLHDATRLSSASPFDARVDFMLAVARDFQAATMMDARYFLWQAEQWGWDSTDLQWEAYAPGPTLLEDIYVLRLQPGYDMAVIEAQLPDNGFAARPHAGITVYTSPLEEIQAWHYQAHLAHHNIALLPEQGILLLSPTYDTLTGALDAYLGAAPALADVPQMLLAAQRLGGVASAVVRRGPEQCRFYGFNGRSVSGNETLALYAPRSYGLLVAGHGYDGAEQSSRLVLAYGSHQDAAADVDIRAALLDEATSPRRNVAYADYFELVSASSEDSLVTMALRPRPALAGRAGWPQTLTAWIQERDALFVGCLS